MHRGLLNAKSPRKNNYALLTYHFSSVCLNILHFDNEIKMQGKNTWGMKKGAGKASSYLDVREEHLEHVGGRVAGVEEHELGLLQVVGGQALLNLKIGLLR